MPAASGTSARSGSRRWLRKFAALGLGLASTCVALEVLLRVAAPQPRSWLEIYRLLPEPLYFGLVPGAECSADSGDEPWSVRVDESGRRVGRGEPGEPGNVPVLGDSFVFGHGIEYERSLVGLLNAAQPGTLRFRNEGVPGYGPIQYRCLLERALAESPAPRGIVVVSYLGNDFFDCIWDKHAIINHGTLGDTGGWRSQVKRHLHLYRFASKLWHAFGPAPKSADILPMYRPGDWPEDPLKQAKSVFEAQFRAMNEACQARSIPLLVVLLPPSDMVKSPGAPEGPLQFDLPTRMAREVLESNHVPFVDASAELVRGGYERNFLRADGHLSAAGNELVRECILTHLRAAPEWQRR